MRELTPGNNYAILDPTKGTLYIAGSYVECLQDIQPRAEYKRLLSSGVRGQCTPEGTWIPGRVAPQIDPAPSDREKKLVAWVLGALLVAILLYWYVMSILGWIG
jgi:hypothetical protein